MKLKLVASTALLAVTLTACGGGGRPSQEDVAKAIKEQAPSGSSAALTDEIIDCIAKKVVDSDLSDDVLNKMVDNDKGSSKEINEASEVVAKASTECATAK